MPINEDSERRKAKILSIVEMRLGYCCRNHPKRHDWYSSKDGTVDVFITDSKAHYDKRPWFDMRDDDLTKLANQTTGFVIFILGDETRYLVIPARDIVEQLPNHQEGLLERGFYHFNMGLGKQVFEQLPVWNLRQYLGKIELIPQKVGSGAIGAQTFAASTGPPIWRTQMIPRAGD
jgi:hypothetical protein